VLDHPTSAPTDAPPSESDGSPDEVTSIGRRRQRRVLRWGVDLLIPFAVFAVRVGTWTLNPLAAPRLANLDWATYITAPNYLRIAPLFSFPIGETPGYMAPVGSSLGLADATPVLTPVYRLLNAIAPHRPTQLLGPLLLLAYLLTFYWSVKFLRRAYVAWRGTRPSLLVEVEVRVAAALLLVLPVFTSRIAHTALTQQWILIAALYCAIFCAQPSTRNDRYVAAVCIGAAVLHPYYVLPVVVISAPYLVRRLRDRWQRGLVLGAGIGFGILAVSLFLGFLSFDASASNEGFGNYASDLAFLVNPHGTSDWLEAFAYAPDTWEGIGFLGVGVLGLAAVAIVAFATRRLRVRPSPPVVLTTLMCVALALFATWPTVHIAGHEVVDLAGTPVSLDFIGNILRTNGRFVWSLTWLVALGACAAVISARWTSVVGLTLVAAAAVVQFADATEFRFVERSEADYNQVSGVIRRQTGITSIEIQPPWIQYECVSPDIPFEDVAVIMLAGATWRAPINSGFPGRPSDDFYADICVAQTSEFAAGRYETDVLYVVNAANSATAQLRCEPLIRALVACRTP
jgi:hypothetical protein